MLHYLFNVRACAESETCGILKEIKSWQRIYCSVLLSFSACSEQNRQIITQNLLCKSEFKCTHQNSWPGIFKKRKAFVWHELLQTSYQICACTLSTYLHLQVYTLISAFVCNRDNKHVSLSFFTYIHVLCFGSNRYSFYIFINTWCSPWPQKCLTDHLTYTNFI